MAEVMNVGTAVSYNGVTIYNCVTREFSSETVYDPSGTDTIGRTVRFTFTGLIHSQSIGDKAPTGIDFNAVARDTAAPAKSQWFQELLSQPRKILVVKINNVEYFRCSPANQNNITKVDVDTNNGPRPLSAVVTSVISDKVFRVSFSIECRLSHCSYMSGTGFAKTKATPIVSNRWSVRESMDDNYFLTRTISGHIIFTHSLSSAHAYKSQCVPPLEDGFRRESIEFDELPNGLEATYSVTDRQTHTAAPWPLTKFSARHEEQINDALDITSSMTVNCYGDPHTRKQDMLIRAVQIADARLEFTNPKRQNFHYTHVGLIDDMGDENHIELSIGIRRYDKSQRTTFDLMAVNLGKTLKLPTLPNAQESAGSDPYNPRRSRRPALWGYDSKGPRNPVQSFLLHCYLQTPCDPQKGMWQGVKEQPQPKLPDQPTTLATAIDGGIVDSLSPPPPSDLYSPGHSEAIYVHAAMTSRYVTDTIRAQMPLAYQAGEDTARTVKLSGGACKRIIKVDCERLGKVPLIPSPMEDYRDGKLIGRLLRYWVEAHPPTVSPTGDKKVFRLTAYYVYAMNRPPKPDEKVRTGVMPFTSFTLAETALNLKEAFSKTMGP